MLGLKETPTAKTPEAQPMRQLAGFTFIHRHGKPGEIMVEAQAVDQHGQPLECLVPVLVWLSSLANGVGVAQRYLAHNSRNSEEARTLRPFLSGCILGIDDACAVLRLQTTSEGRIGVRFHHADDVYLAVQGGGMLRPAVSRRLTRTDFGKDLERLGPSTMREPKLPPLY